MSLPPQTQLGRYEIRSLIGAGGMGEVYVAHDIAAFHARLGQNDEAIKWLEKAYEEHDTSMPWIGVATEFDSIRSDPRFKELVRRLGLPE
jgi:serine/threonine protein kinase